MKLRELFLREEVININQIEAFADRVFAKVGIDVNFTRHFIDRLRTRDAMITSAELTRLFKQEAKRWGKPIAQMGPEAQGVMKDLKTDVNVPFVLQWDDTNQELDLIAKTVMKKKNFSTPNKEFPIEDANGLDAETLSPKALAKHHNVPMEQIINQIKKGIRVEMEHTSDKKIAYEIALDHIKELPDYYDRLKKVEKDSVKESFDTRVNWQQITDGERVQEFIGNVEGSEINMEYFSRKDDTFDDIDVSFGRNNSIDVTGEGNAAKIFGAVINHLIKFANEYKSSRITFSADKRDGESRTSLYTRMVDRLAKQLGYTVTVHDDNAETVFELKRISK